MADGHMTRAHISANRAMVQTSSAVRPFSTPPFHPRSKVREGSLGGEGGSDEDDAEGRRTDDAGEDEADDAGDKANRRTYGMKLGKVMKRA